MFIYILSFFITLMISSCAESFEKKAERDAILFTSKQCPKMVDNSGVILDSVVFNSDSFTRTEFYTLTGPSDDGLEQADYVDEFYQELIETIKHLPSYWWYRCRVGFGCLPYVYCRNCSI